MSATELHLQLRDLAAQLAAEAASLLLGAQGGPRTDVTTKSSATDMVTEMDRAAEELIVGRLREARPDDSILGEEGAAVRGTSGCEWVVDPLDGTTNYLYGHPGWGVSVAVRHHGEVVAGAVVDATAQLTFDAVAGGGARCNGDDLRIEDGVGLASALVATGFSYDPIRRRLQAAVLEQVLPRVRDIRRMGAAAVDLCSVAAGRVDAFYERGLQPWDWSAGALVAAEAGALVGDLDGGSPSTDFVLAAPASVFEELRALLADAGAGSA